MKYFLIAVFVFICLPILMFGCNIMGFGLNWMNRAGQVVTQEVDPAYMLQKYEWFKNAAAQLDNKRATIKILKSRYDLIVKNSDRTRTDKEEGNLALSEMTGVKASYNSLAAEYNSQMAKLNWRFCNVGQLPPGATEVLPREYRDYLEE